MGFEASILARKSSAVFLKFSSSFVSFNIYLETYLELVVGPHGQKNLSNPHPSCGAVGFAIGTPHSGLEPGEEADLTFEENMDKMCKTWVPLFFRCQLS